MPRKRSRQTININTATADELSKGLEGVGLKKAHAIVDYRTANGPFVSADDLLKVKGITANILKQNKKTILVEVTTTDQPAPEGEVDVAHQVEAAAVSSGGFVDKLQRQSPAFFTLSPARLAEALEKAMPMGGLSPEQQLYARAVLLQTASVGANILDEEARLESPARKNSPLYSMARSGPQEAILYKLIQEGDVSGVRSTTQKQVLTFTTHPNFSRSRELAHKSRELSVELGNLSVDARRAIENTGALPTDHSARIEKILGEMKGMFTPRQKRSRKDELQESVLDIIPTVMKAASEQIKIYKQRSKILTPGEPGKDTGQETTIEHYENGEPVLGADGKPKVTKLPVKVTKETAFSSVKQLDALAAVMPEYNSWYMDGDGKRACHVYDAELAMPAVKRYTYQEYSHLLQKLPEDINGFNPEEWRKKLESRIQIFKRAEELAATRMNALNALQEAYAKTTGSGSAIGQGATMAEPIRIAEEAGHAYMDFLERSAGDGKRVKDVLKEDLASPLKEALGAVLEATYKAPESLDESDREKAEDLYIKVAAYGNFSVHMQRRENALQYRKVFSFLVENSDDVREFLAAQLGVKKTEVIEEIDGSPERYLQAVKVFAEHVANPEDQTGMKTAVTDFYKQWARKIEKQKQGIKALTSDQLLALDDLGCFHMAGMYPEAFKGGFIIAEFAQPDIEVLRSGDDELIKNEVVRRAQTDMLIQLAFASAMGASKAELIPLHEDPATMKYIPQAQAALREGPLGKYLSDWMGVSDPEVAKKHALRYFNEEGKTEPLTAYQYLRHYGVGVEELKKSGLDVEKLQKLHVLEGPYDMEACSDNNKRSSIIGSLLAEHSIREKAIEWARNPMIIGDQSYMIVKPKYLGQGGSIARATEVPIDSEQATWQGEHMSSLVPKSLAYKCYNFLLGRLTWRQETCSKEKAAARNQTQYNFTGMTDEDAIYRTMVLEETAGARKAQQDTAITRRFVDRIMETPGHVSNVLGFSSESLTESQRELVDKTITARIASTRDDPRYNEFLSKYGQAVPNYSARSDNKNGLAGKSDFNEERAIGTAAKEAGMWSNIIGIAALFDYGTQGAGKGKVTAESIREINQWKEKDPAIQHILTAGVLIANLVNPEEVWARGNVIYSRNEGQTTLTKGRLTVSLGVLKKAYDEKRTEYRDAPSGEVFDAADLVMAHLTDQFQRLEKGLHGLYPGKADLMEMIDPAHRDTIKAYKSLSDDILKKLRETKLAEGQAKTKDRELLEGAYHVIFESGGMFPSLSLMEPALYNQARVN